MVGSYMLCRTLFICDIMLPSYSEESDHWQWLFFRQWHFTLMCYFTMRHLRLVKFNDHASPVCALPPSVQQGCGSGYFSIASASASTPIASASAFTIKKRDPQIATLHTIVGLQIILHCCDRKQLSIKDLYSQKFCL